MVTLQNAKQGGVSSSWLTLGLMQHQVKSALLDTIVSTGEIVVC